jgi:hypothetical protein
MVIKIIKGTFFEVILEFFQTVDIFFDFLIKFLERELKRLNKTKNIVKGYTPRTPKK